jgi:hypothetical protein
MVSGIRPDNLNLFAIFIQTRHFWHCDKHTETQNANFPVVKPNKAVCIVDPLINKLLN